MAIQEIEKRQSGTAMNGVGYSDPGAPMFTLQASAQHGVLIAAHRAGDSGTVSSKWAKSSGGPAGDEYYNLIAFSSKDDGRDAGELSPTLRSMNFDKSHINGGGQVAIAFKPSHYTRDKDGAPSEVSPPLSADADKGDQEAVIFQPRVEWQGGVRRLTPIECERLQGFPDNWTAGFSDSVRYRMLGNAVAVPVARWIAKRLMEAAHEA